MDVVLDFDGTITEQDTISTLAAHAVSRNGGQSDWDGIVRAYMQDYERHVANYVPRTADRTTPGQELDFLAGLRPVELASVARVSHSVLFRDMSPDDLVRFGAQAVADGRVRLRGGFADLLAALPGRLAVVSVNWSADFVRGCCGLDGLEVRANEVEFPAGRIRGTGEAGDLIVTADDKRAAFEGVAAAWGKPAREIVYVGDSGTDLGCLLAGRGVVMSADGETSVLKTLRRVGVEARHAGECEPGFKVAWARDFREVLNSDILSAPTS